MSGCAEAENWATDWFIGPFIHHSLTGSIIFLINWTCLLIPRPYSYCLSLTVVLWVYNSTGAVNRDQTNDSVDWPSATVE